MLYLGIDTSNYKSSLALFDTESGAVKQESRLLKVDDGELGLRQSEAVFQHIKNMPALFEALFSGSPAKLDGVGVSVSPRNVEDSYMPCFLAGKGAAIQTAALLDIPVFEYSHQEGHLAAALLGAGKCDILKQRKTLYAFHLSGGTTELLKAKLNPRSAEIERLACKRDICAGQLIDRVGVNMGGSFPAGGYVDALALSGKAPMATNCYRSSGFDFSGIENKALGMLADGAAKENIAAYVMETIALSLKSAVDELVPPGYEIIMSGGVSASEYLRAYFEKHGYGSVIFTKREFSGDNAAGTAYLAALEAMEKNERRQTGDDSQTA